MHEQPPAAVPDEGLVRRLKALACTGPLHAMDARKTRLDWADAEIYQMAEVALHAIDLVAIAMDFDRGADPGQVLAKLRPRIAAQAPERDRAEHERVAEWVLENLINVGTVDRGFRSVYGAVDRGGTYRRRTFDFKLLEELRDAEGNLHLRASNEAINVLVGALDTDVESAQIAAEVKLANLIERGRLADARLAAEAARYRTVQYAENLRRKLDATRRDVRSVDWTHEVPDMIEEALVHIGERYRAESAILRNITAARDESEDAEHKRKAADLVRIVADCIRRHTQLQARLQTAGETFRGEQDRQQFSGVPQRTCLDLFGQLLMPALESPLAWTARPVDVFFRAAAGPRRVTVLGLVGLVDLLLTPVADREPLLDELAEPELAPGPEADRYTEHQWDQASELLELDGVACRLSGLLTRARDLDPVLPELVALRVLHAYSPELGVALRQGDPRVLVAVDDGTALRDKEFGGADLLVGVAELPELDARPESAGDREAG
ncbi:MULTISPECIES: hypothetical protein [unclassified Crossiella]|uniref:hypothetical protein n=1 Tax=unclassified Crossiella TaxID=2620835 RepID=UPI001FFE63A3|nr:MULTISPECIES: hypothetical protein [unclassified Crossiella]MCK2239251.1 hypothetical protein [Crossiella sp. S99.2]MCK2251180.1 hypothetical protein [Crossiella sp. S99.1]